LQMMYEAAKKRGITNDPKTKLLSELGNKSLCARELMNKIASEVNVPDANVREYYEKNKYSDPQLFEPNRFSFTHIRTATAQEANAVKKRIESGEDIEGIAKEVSIAPDARNGGVVKKLPESMLLQQYGKAFVDALKASSEGQVIGPIKTNDGYEVVRHEGKLIAKAYPYEMVKGIIKQRLESTTKAEAQQKFLEDLKKADESKVYISPLIEAPKPAAQEQKLRTEPNLPVDKTKNKTDNSKQK
jgi:peptidyl-prolyl cis-trans isomerase C